MSLEVFINTIVILTNLTVGERLLRHGRKSDELPATLLGAAFVADGVEWLLWTLALYSPAEGTVVADFLSVGCRLGIGIAHGFMLAFVYVVFRPGQGWALLLGACVTLTLTLGIVVGVLQGDWMGFQTDNVWVWMEVGSALVAYVWCMLEAGRHYLRMRRRLAHGLADPVVTNRMLLWCGYGGLVIATQSIYIGAILLAQNASSYPAFYDNLMVATTIASAGAVWLAFLPPKAYLRWVTARHPAIPA